MKATRRSITVEAIQWTGTTLSEQPHWIRTAQRIPKGQKGSLAQEGENLLIVTKDDQKRTAGPGDYLILEPNGDIKPYTQEEFAKHYTV